MAPIHLLSLEPRKETTSLSSSIGAHASSNLLIQGGKSMKGTLKQSIVITMITYLFIRRFRRVRITRGGFQVTRGLPHMLTLGKGLVDITVTVASFLYCTDWV